MPKSQFPPIEQAMVEPNGLLAQGGELTPQSLLDAYAHGIFPWPSDVGEDEQALLWWSPNPREILKPQEFHLSRSLQKTLRKNDFKITLNHSFDEVVASCASIKRSKPDASTEQQTEATWINNEMRNAYSALNQLGHAHSIDVWLDGELVGGLYGVSIGRLFCGESMFHRRRDASKVALLALCIHMQKVGWPLIDCQLENPHLRSLGSKSMSRAQFASFLPTKNMEWSDFEASLTPPMEFKPSAWPILESGQLLDRATILYKTS